MNSQQPDWPACIRRLEKSGMTQQQIANKVGTSQPTVNRIKSGPYKVTWDTGMAILMCLGELEENNS